jgi:hypothetical protein
LLDQLVELADEGIIIGLVGGLIADYNFFDRYINLPVKNGQINARIYGLADLGVISIQ